MTGQAGNFVWQSGSNPFQLQALPLKYEAGVFPPPISNVGMSFTQVAPFSFLRNAPIPPTQESAERVQFCIFGTSRSRSRNTPTRTI